MNVWIWITVIPSELHVLYFLATHLYRPQSPLCMISRHPHINLFSKICLAGLFSVPLAFLPSLCSEWLMRCFPPIMLEPFDQFYLLISSLMTSFLQVRLFYHGWHPPCWSRMLCFGCKTIEAYENPIISLVLISSSTPVGEPGSISYTRSPQICTGSLLLKLSSWGFWKKDDSLNQNLRRKMIPDVSQQQQGVCGHTVAPGAWQNRTFSGWPWLSAASDLHLWWEKQAPEHCAAGQSKKSRFLIGCLGILA